MAGTSAHCALAQAQNATAFAALQEILYLTFTSNLPFHGLKI